jgi:hypothetical protein
LCPKSSRRGAVAAIATRHAQYLVAGLDGQQHRRVSAEQCSLVERCPVAYSHTEKSAFTRVDAQLSVRGYKFAAAVCTLPDIASAYVLSLRIGGLHLPAGT